MSTTHPSKPTHSRSDTALIHGLSTVDFAKLAEICTNAKAKAYCPYSKFRVGAAILTKSGRFYEGANVENAAYPSGLCAERTAMGPAVVDGARPGDIRAVAVATDASTPSSPCGACRQYMSEFCDGSVPVIMYDKEGRFVVMTMDQLLPMSFSMAQLKSSDAAASSLDS